MKMLKIIVQNEYNKPQPEFKTTYESLKCSPKTKPINVTMQMTTSKQYN